MSVPYLATDHYALRPLTADDAATASAWLPSPFPVGPAAAARWLEEHHRWSPWDDPAELWLAVERIGDGRETVVLGSVRVLSPRGRTVDAIAHLDPSLPPAAQDAALAGVVTIVVPWVMGELEAWSLTVPIPDDRPAARAAAGQLGLVPTVRLREALARPGGRSGLWWYQAFREELPRPAGDVQPWQGCGDA